MNDVLSVSISDIFNEINRYIFKKENVDVNYVYIDGTKIAANANKYSWVWKKGRYPEYPVADAGYGSFNNYLYCEEHGMKKYMKFTMFKKECEDKSYREDPYRAINFPINENGNPVCPNGKEFHYLKTRPVRGNKYERTEEIYQCEDCSNCPHKSKCSTTKEIRSKVMRVFITNILKLSV